jgi:hypothetical protein
VKLEEAQRLWRFFVDKDIPYPESLRNDRVVEVRRHGTLVLLMSVLLALSLGFSLGWLIVDNGGPRALFGAGTPTSSQARVDGAVGEANLPPIRIPDARGSTESATTPSVAPSVPASASPGLRDIAADGQASPDIQSASPSPMPSFEPNADALLALRELREVIQRGGRVDENLFRRLPRDIQDILRAEGFAPPDSPPEATGGAARPADARLPTGAVLRGGADAQGVPVLPRRLPPGDAAALPVPMPGGGDLREAEDFRAFGLQAPGSRQEPR